jgi:hypothetical protein
MPRYNCPDGRVCVWFGAGGCHGKCALEAIGRARYGFARFPGPFARFCALYCLIPHDNPRRSGKVSSPAIAASISARRCTSRSRNTALNQFGAPRLPIRHRLKADNVARPLRSFVSSASRPSYRGLPSTPLGLRLAENNASTAFLMALRGIARTTARRLVTPAGRLRAMWLCRALLGGFLLSLSVLSMGLLLGLLRPVWQPSCGADMYASLILLEYWRLVSGLVIMRPR